jgi:hypothetical protein
LDTQTETLPEEDGYVKLPEKKWSDVATSQKVPRIVRGHQMASRGQKTFPLGLQRDPGPADTLILSFWLPEL